MMNVTDGERKTTGDARVWYVDDSDCVRELLVELLGEHCGLKIAKNFACPHAMLAELGQGEPPDVLLMDVNLANQESGLDMIAPTLRTSPATRVVMITTFSDSCNENQAMMAGASAFLLKSERPEAIAEAIHRVCRSPLPRVAQAVKPAREHVREPAREASARFRSEKLGMLRHLFGWRRLSSPLR
jgi:DNA-binding NarL/FixJ family response regulator